MRIIKLSDVRNEIFLLVGQAALFICSILFIFYFYHQTIAPDKKVAEEFTMTTCTIADKGMSVEGRTVHRYRADFRVNYSTNMGPTNSVTSANGLDFSYTTNRAAQQEYLDEFEIGSIYPCWYNPQSPSAVVLVLRHSWYSTLPLILPSLIAALMLLYMIRSMVDLFHTYKAYQEKKRS
jgi:hypothetical protein